MLIAEWTNAPYQRADSVVPVRDHGIGHGSHGFCCDLHAGGGDSNRGIRDGDHRATTQAGEQH